jgi:AcrR family transcriptional regulator
MTDPVINDPPEAAIEAEEGAHAATKAAVFAAAERLFALHGFQNVSVRDITAEARVNLASVNYHFGSKDALLFEIFRRRTGELNRERARMLHEANDRHAGKPPVRDILEALFAPPLRWADPAHERRISVQFIIRARSEGTEEIRQALQNDVSHLARFADALKKACPELTPETVYWRLHFVLGMAHNNRFMEFDRLHHLSGGLTREGDVAGLLTRMLDFAEAGFLAP